MTRNCPVMFSFTLKLNDDSNSDQCMDSVQNPEEKSISGDKF